MTSQAETGRNAAGLLATLAFALVLWAVPAFLGGDGGIRNWPYGVSALVLILGGIFLFRQQRLTGQGLATVALVVAILSVIWFALAALGSKWGFWDWRFGLLKMTVQLGQNVAAGGIALSLGALVIGLATPSRVRPAILAIGAVLIMALLGGRLVGLQGGAQAVPPIHDIQTDWSNPVVFSDALMAARGDGSNPVRYGGDAVFLPADNPQFGGRLIADIQEAAECTSNDPDVCEDDQADKPYRPIEPLVLSAAPEAVFAAAERLACAEGWEIVTADAPAGLIEATHASPWWGFKDDMAIRIRAEGEGTRVDMRSVSRVGVSDLGANARRVSAFLYDLAGQRYE